MGKASSKHVDTANVLNVRSFLDHLLCNFYVTSFTFVTKAQIPHIFYSLPNILGCTEKTIKISNVHFPQHKKNVNYVLLI